ncbi:MAG: acyl-CoA dehydrogenase family protein [Burkholderia sp.]|jgi:acyl-CoA dehydrogenase|uniref:acyl-CoA dehydrogenase family protein n=1 Tax=Burkholderia sp. TaxID=36773 RepID=UPI002823ECAE|nr:acyl-CoA dehydrogenase family protein [Burkholderia sp.]MDR0246524.1 acyl-CoA dehydrogenase family protein [Burkholderia sp.]
MALDLKPAWMDADLEVFKDTVARFLDSELAPGDEEARKRGHVGHDIWRRAGELGLLCTDIPEAYGGMGGDFRHEALIYDQMSHRALSGMATVVHSIVAHYLLNHGTEAQKCKYLPRMASGELVGAIAMTEPGAGSDLQGIRTRAQRQGDHYLLNGSKTFISNGLLAGLVLVVAKTDPTLGAKGMSIFIVETADCPGFRVGRLLDKIGLKAQDTSELFFDDVCVAPESLLGEVEGRGFAQLMSDLPYERTLIGVGATGAMEGAFEATRDYVRERHAFGQPLAQMQHVRFKLADIATMVRVARVFVDRCVQDLLNGQLDAAGASMLKLWATEQQGRVIDDCLQLFGGYGYMNEYLIARMYTDARVQRIFGGANEVMREVVARAL